MTIADVFKDAISRDLSGVLKGQVTYNEMVIGDKFKITLKHIKDRDAFIQCEAPDNGLEDERNYLRLYFLSMVFNAAIWGMKKMKSNKKRL